MENTAVEKMCGRCYPIAELYPNKTGSIDKLKAHLLESNQEIAPLKVWQLQDLSLQAAERIKAAPKDEALSIMSQISQNFPLQARSLVRTAVRDELRKEVKKNQKIIQNEIGIQPSDAFLLVNGLTYDMDTIDPFSLLDSLKTEHKKMEGLHQLGLNQETVVKMLSLDIGKSKSTSSKGSPSYALDIRDTAVVYVNDIEKDPSYAKWPSQLLELLRPVFPGMLRSIRRNIFHLVLLVDPAEKTSAELVKIAESFYVHKAPIRIGFVLSVDPREEVTGNDDAGVAMLLGFNAVSSVKNAAAGLSFLTDVSLIPEWCTIRVYAKAGADPVTPEIVREVMKRLRPKDNLDEIFGADSTYDYGRQLARDFISRTGLERLPQVLMNGIPLEQKHLNADGFEEGAIMALSSQMNVLQQAVYDGSLTDSDNVLDFLMRQPNVMPRLNNRILTGDNDEVKYVDASSLFSDPKDDDLTQKVFSNFPYFSSKSGSMGTKPVTVWLAVDVNNRQGLGIVRAAASHIAGDPNMRIGLLFNAEDVNNDRLAKAVLSVIQSQENRVAAEVLDAFLTDKNVKKFVEGNLEPVQLNVKGFDLLSYSKAFDALDMSSILNLHRQYSSKMLNVRPGQAVVICNGRVIGPLGAKEDFVESDFLLLSRYVSSTSADAIIQMLLEVKAQGKQGRTLSDYVVGATTVLLSQGAAKSRLELPALVSDSSTVHLSSQVEGEPYLDIVGIVDPLTRGAQLMASLVSTVMKVLPSKVRLYMNCVEKHSEMPMKSFFRYVLASEPEFEPETGSLVAPVAKFLHLPTEPILTMGLKIPENWLVGLVRSPYDLDNIRLKDVEGGVYGKSEVRRVLRC
ncbi:unnamed protein product [Notodromas monacha]|uniref:Uncharacterized protein n=1 Tax=Notodromas monacha TaxID=399045 RepID=A0A7R9BPW6_9CRUS|nr:unnamed protein product [Notodromas monacha]CAG0918616.1 unnamed protein product [Notodromas monacha]